MRKIIVGLLFAALAACGLVGASGTSASADPYPGTVATTIHITAKKAAKVGRRAKASVIVTASGNVNVTGTVKITIRRSAGGFKMSQKFPFTGGTVSMSTTRLTLTGKYKIKVKYKPVAGSVFKKSKAKFGFVVKPRHK